MPKTLAPGTGSLITATNLFAVARDGIRYAYRRFGATSGTVPLLLMQHFRGNMDTWDPTLIDTLAADREVIVFDNAGVALTDGVTPSSVAEMAADALCFLDALDLDQVDLLGFSLGGFVAQEVALVRPDCVRRLILAGTGPEGAPKMHGWREDIAHHARAKNLQAEDLLYILFPHTGSSQTDGAEYLGRIFQRVEDRDPSTDVATRDAQYDAVVRWGIPDTSKLQRLTGIRHSTLILQGDDDLMIPTPESHLLAGLIPDAKLTIFTDAAHGSIFQYPAAAAAAISHFLDA